MAAYPGFLAPQPPTGRRVFLADLHLDGEDSVRALTFRVLLRRLGEEADQVPTELYILGDLFEFWDEYHTQVILQYEQDLKALEEAHKAGVKIVLLYGNRDFMYGSYVQNRLGARIIEDGDCIKLSDERKVWLEHGDLLCTRDTRYLKYRKWVRSRTVRLVYRLMPWSIAKRIVQRISKRSSSEKSSKSDQDFELDLEAAKSRLEEHQCMLLMCGHTHVPQATDLGGGARLLVLPAWCDSCSGYREKNGSLRAVHFREDGFPVPADFSGMPADA